MNRHGAEFPPGPPTHHQAQYPYPYSYTGLVPPNNSGPLPMEMPPYEIAQHLPTRLGSQPNDRHGGPFCPGNPTDTPSAPEAKDDPRVHQLITDVRRLVDLVQQCLARLAQVESAYTKIQPKEGGDETIKEIHDKVQQLNAGNAPL